MANWRRFSARSDTEREAENAFKEAWLITKARSQELVGRRELRAMAVAHLGRSAYPTVARLSVERRGEIVDVFLDNDAAMRRVRGYVPARVVEAIEEAAWLVANGHASV